MKLDGRSGGGATVFSHELRPAAESETARQRSPIKTKKKRGRFSLLPSFFSFCSVLFFSTDRVNRRTGSGRRSRGADVRIMFADSRPFLSIRLGLDPTASSRKKKRNEKKRILGRKATPISIEEKKSNRWPRPFSLLLDGNIGRCGGCCLQFELLRRVSGRTAAFFTGFLWTCT